MWRSRGGAAQVARPGAGPPPPTAANRHQRPPPVTAVEPTDSARSGTRSGPFVRGGARRFPPLRPPHACGEPGHRARLCPRTASGRLGGRPAGGRGWWRRVEAGGWVSARLCGGRCDPVSGSFLRAAASRRGLFGAEV